MSINIFVKKNKNKKLAQVFHNDLYGVRQHKYDFLNDNCIESIEWFNLDYKEPYFFFVPVDYLKIIKYNKGFKVSNIYSVYNSGIQTKRDKLTISYDINQLKNIINDLKTLEIEEIRKKYLLPPDGRDWKICYAKKDLNKGYRIISIQYRLFDYRFTAYTGKSKGFIAYPRQSVTNHFTKSNLGFIFKRTGRIYGNSYDFIFVSNSVISEGIFAIDPLGREYIAPLYLYPDQETDGVFAQEDVGEKGRKPNLNMQIVEKIAKKLGLKFVTEKDTSTSSVSGSAIELVEIAPIDILDYIYAVLHSPTYREKYKEFLKIDFPRVPYPKNLSVFKNLTALGSQLRQIHLLESPKTEEYITSYPIDGNNTITTKISKKDWEITGTIKDLSGFENLTGLPKGRIWINETQYFDNIPLTAWEFYIGGYQPAQKWLKDRKGRTLSFEDILHYQKIIVALSETDRIMKEIDKIEIE